MRISLIAALGKNRELGKDNKMLWHIKEDFKHFKETTLGHTLLMGRKTYESIGRPLPGRSTFILTRDEHYQQEGCTRVESFEKAIELAKEKGEEELFVAGGGEIYKQFLPQCDRLILSYVDYEGDADTFFPEFDESHWDIQSKEEFKEQDKSPGWSLVIMDRAR